MTTATNFEAQLPSVEYDMDTLHQLEELAIENLTGNNNKFYFYLNDLQICDMNVAVGLTFKKYCIENCVVIFELKLTIESKNIISEKCDGNYIYFNQYYNLDKKNIRLKEQLIMAFNKLNSITAFDRYTGDFEFDDKDNDQKIRKMKVSCNKLFKNKNIKVCDDTCCVCLEQTLTKTCCNHSLCFYCWENIKPIEQDDDPEMKDIFCPMCREEINYVNESD